MVGRVEYDQLVKYIMTSHVDMLEYTQWPWVSSQNWLMLRRLQNFKYTLRSNNLKQMMQFTSYFLHFTVSPL